MKKILEFLAVIGIFLLTGCGVKNADNVLKDLEKKVNNNNTVYVTVEDLEQKMDSIKDKIEEIKDVKLVKENEDGTKQYVIEANGDTDLRKVIFSEFAKENITIFEMKKADITLEDAFMQLIEGGEK